MGKQIINSLQELDKSYYVHHYILDVNITLVFYAFEAKFKEVFASSGDGLLIRPKFMFVKS